MSSPIRIPYFLYCPQCGLIEEEEEPGTVFQCDCNEHVPSVLKRVEHIAERAAIYTAIMANMTTKGIYDMIKRLEKEDVDFDPEQLTETEPGCPPTSAGSGSVPDSSEQESTRGGVEPRDVRVRVGGTPLVSPP